jgi:hypothetical protein
LDFIPRRINGPAEKEIRPDEVDEDLPEPRHDAVYISYKHNESIDSSATGRALLDRHTQLTIWSGRSWMPSIGKL